jgi:hypothetical protein
MTCVCDLSYCPACEPQRQAHKFSGRPVPGSVSLSPSPHAAKAQAGASPRTGAAAGRPETTFDDPEGDCGA